MTIPRLLRLLGLLTLSTLALAACGSSSNTTTTTKVIPTAPSGGTGTTVTGQGTGTILQITAKDIDLVPDTATAAAGKITIDYVNEGQIRHTLRIDGKPQFQLEVKRHGDTDHGTIQLSPGTYTLFCNVPGHRPNMETKLTVS